MDDFILFFLMLVVHVPGTSLKTTCCIVCQGSQLLLYKMCVLYKRYLHDYFLAAIQAVTPVSRQAVAGTPVRGQGVSYQHQSSSGASNVAHNDY